ncbi:Hypothetical predicted protein [Mytilus galloprovincialis]|uniref:Fucolectin tachylectin-4 pentraxin-1 domain-containing protein n=1 Tax=Mytilus galloprovincialis TaxID=29158 RepID=A0A8B6HM76_MYTGA|nr:Hypothetical predicted protein [Mytilus galloprovincialis]
MSPRACFKECIRRPQCFSYNYDKVHFTCEINLKPDSVSLVYFPNVIGYIYVVIQHYRGNPLFDPCIGHPCSTDEVCEILKNNKTVCVKDGFNKPHKTFLNVALKKYTQQISTAGSDLSASRAVDGLTNTWSRTHLELLPYLWVDLGTIYNIIRIEIINRNAYGPGTNGEHLVFQCKGWYLESRFVKMTIIKGILQISSDKTEIFTINPDKRDVKLQGFTYRSFDQTTSRGCLVKCIRRPLCHSYNYNIAHLTCELNMTPETVSEVYFQQNTGCIYIEIQHYRGNTIFDPCVGNPCSKNEICVRLKNEEIICIKDDVIIPNKNPENVALRKTTEQSSTLPPGYHAYKAVDGLTNTFSHTDLNSSPYWRVDLGTMYNIIRIEIINRDSSGTF